MNIKTLIRRGNELWNVPHASPRLNKRNKKAWVRSVLMLGDRWLLMKKIEKLDTPRP